jgi:DNA-binding protein HU-beta
MDTTTLLIIIIIVLLDGGGILSLVGRAVAKASPIPNPETGEAIKIKASKKVAFRAAKDLKMAG